MIDVNDHSILQRLVRVTAWVKRFVSNLKAIVTRVVHLELVENLSTATFRQWLQRFIGRNRTPLLIVSDNAKTFQATQKALTRLFSHPEVRADLEHDKIEWKFNLERAPWWGVFFERMVSSTKLSEEDSGQCKTVF